MTRPILHIECFRADGLSAYRRKKSYYFFRIRAANGEIVAASEAYNSAQARNKTARLLASAKMEMT